LRLPARYYANASVDATMKNHRLVRYASYASVSVALALLFIKLYAWIQTESVSILASLLDSAFDIIASLMILAAVMIAQIPADKEHRFGHGKAEPIAALAQSAFIFGSALYLIIYATGQLWSQQPVENTLIGISAMIASLTLSTLLIMFQKYVIAKTGSTAIAADFLHYLTDIFTNLLVIVSLLFASYYWLDPLLAILVALWILKSVYNISQQAINQLLDRELPEAMRIEIQEIIIQSNNVRGFNDFRSYQSGPNAFVQFDLELDDELTLHQAHEITERVTQAIKQKFENLDVMVHQEPMSLKHDLEHHQWGQE
jgi:ferrous-iron efflux pump FieF